MAHIDTDLSDLQTMCEQLPPEVYSSLQALALSGMPLEDLKVACLDAVANYNRGNAKMDEEIRPKKKRLDLSSYYLVPKNENDPDGPCGIFDDGGYEDETDSILKRLQVFRYETIIVTEDVATVLLDRDPNCFAGCPDFQMIDGK